MLLSQESIGLQLVCDRFRFEYWNVSMFLSLLAGCIWGRNGAVIRWTEEGRVGSEVCVEVDLRSSKKEERKIRFILDGKIQKCVIVGVGNEIRYGVWNNNPIFFFTYISIIYHYCIVLIRFPFMRILELDLLAI